MFFDFRKKMLILLLMVFMTSMPLFAKDDHNLTDAQLHAVMGIITSFILSSAESPKETALKKIEAYAQSDGNSTAPTVADYAHAEIQGVDTRILDVVNDVVASRTALQVDTKVEIQIIVLQVLSAPPVLTLIGDEIVFSELGSPYVEFGASAVDVVDGNLTAAIVIAGTIDIHWAGAQFVTYTVTDEDNNTATISREVRVVDTTPPLFTSDSNTTVAENQTDAITLIATDANSITYSISGGESSSFDMNATTGVVTFKVAPDFETLDTYTFTAMATDGSGNVGTQEVTIDISNIDEGITHNGTAYGTVISPYTGKEWLDRNLGASRVCTILNDAQCYGDYYQWGRNFDGHQESNSSTISTQAMDVNSVGSSFIKSSDTYAYDWAKSIDSDGSLRSSNWSKTDGSSVCPVGFRVPTLEELRVELLDAGSAEIQNKYDAFNSFLALPSAGYRYDSSASMWVVGSWGLVWAGSVDGSFSHNLGWGSGYADWGDAGRASGRSVRCLRD